LQNIIHSPSFHPHPRPPPSKGEGNKVALALPHQRGRRIREKEGEKVVKKKAGKKYPPFKERSNNLLCPP